MVTPIKMILAGDLLLSRVPRLSLARALSATNPAPIVPTIQFRKFRLSEPIWSRAVQPRISISQD